MPQLPETEILQPQQVYQVNAKKILVLTQNLHITQQLEMTLSTTGKYQVFSFTQAAAAVEHLNQFPIHLSLVELDKPLLADFFSQIGHGDYKPPMVLLCPKNRKQIPLELLAHNIKGYLQYPLEPQEIHHKLNDILATSWTESEYKKLVDELSSFNHSLEDRIKEATVLQGIGRSVNMTLDLDSVLNRVVEAATFITKAEEGYLMLRDLTTSELYLRAAKDMGERKARITRLKVNDSLAGSVVQSGQPITLNGDTDEHFKVKTGYIVHSLINVPLKIGQQVIGILGVDNPSNNRSFTSDDLRNLMNLASSAATAIENARIYNQTVTSLAKRIEELDTLRALLHDFNLSTDQTLTVQLVLSQTLKTVEAELGILGWLGATEPIWAVQGPLAAGLLNSDNPENSLPQKQQELQALMLNQHPLLQHQPNSAGPTASRLVVPIWWENEPVGIINLESSQAEAFNQNDLYFVQAVANHIALALQTSDLVQTMAGLQERLSLLMNNTEDAVWVVDTKLEVLDLNRMAGQLLAWQPDQAIGQAGPDLWTKNSHSGHREIGKYLEQAMVLAKTISFGQGLTLTAENSQDIFVEGAAYPLFDRGRVIGAVAIFRPASPDRDVELMQTEFISMASHNLRTPLMSILASLDHVLEVGKDPAKNHQMLLLARSQSQKIAEFLRELLDISHITVGREAPLNIKAVDLLALMRTALTEWQSQNPDFQYQLQADDQLPLVATDAIKTAIILQNLLAHAKRRSKPGDLLQVVIKPQGETLVTSIVDSGPVVPPQNYQQIFSPVYPLEMNKANGAMPYSYGVGLYGTRRLLTLLGGTIWISQPNPQGLSLNFSLPIYQ